jgi:hypothetical protein
VYDQSLQLAWTGHGAAMAVAHRLRVRQTSPGGSPEPVVGADHPVSELTELLSVGFIFLISKTFWRVVPNPIVAPKLEVVANVFAEDSTFGSTPSQRVGGIEQILPQLLKFEI